jgi:hypothetical protein
LVRAVVEVIGRSEEDFIDTKHGRKTRRRSVD